MYAKNPVFRRIRDAALRAGFRYTERDPGAYFGFPLTALDTVLKTRRIPYRDNVAALRHLEHARPGFFKLGDLAANRPTPNYLLHESAHAVAFRALFGKPRDVQSALRDPARLQRVILCEAFAMAAEYLAACAVSGQPHSWFFSINSYRHRTPKKKAVGELMASLGDEAVAHALLLAFYANNCFAERLNAKQVDAILSLGVRRRVSQSTGQRVRQALNGLMVMSPEFRLHTTRLFLCMFGYPRDVRRLLSVDPLKALRQDQELAALAIELARVLVVEPMLDEHLVQKEL